MSTRPLPALTLAAIHRYRRSDLAARTAGCCRFSPSCSHYAEEALRRRAYPVALALIVRRILRCRPSVPAGTWDPVPRCRPGARRRWSAVFLLSGIVTLGTIGVAQAVTPLSLPPTTTVGGCQARINNADIGGFNRNHPLVVKQNQAVIIDGLAPQEVRNKPEPAGARTVATIDVELISPFSKSNTPKITNGYRKFTSLTTLDEYLKYGSGLYRVTVHATGSANGVRAWTCSATFYVKLNGNTAAAFVGGLVAVTGLAGAATASGKSDWAVGDILPTDGATPGAESVTRETAEGLYREIAPDDAANRRADGEAVFGCLVVIFLFMFDSWVSLDPTAAAVAVRPAGGRYWRRGHAVRGFLGGLFAGLGLAVLLQQRGYLYFTWRNTILYPILLALVGGWRGWRGRAFTVTTTPKEEAAPTET